MCVGKFCGGDTFVVGRVKSSVTNVIHYRTRKQIGILQDDTERAAQIGFFDLVDIYSVVANLAVCNIVKPVYKVCYGRFSGTRRADERYLLTGARVQRHVMQNYLFGNVTEIHVIENYIAFKRSVRYRPVGFVRMLPRPQLGTFFALFDIAVFVVFCIDQSNVTVVGFGLFVDNRKNTFCARKPHKYGVHLLRYVGNALRKVPAHRQKRDYYGKIERRTRDRKRLHPRGQVCNGKHRTYKRKHDIEQVPEIVHHRT